MNLDHVLAINKSNQHINYYLNIINNTHAIFTANATIITKPRQHSNIELYNSTVAELQQQRRKIIQLIEAGKNNDTMTDKLVSLQLTA